MQVGDIMTHYTSNCDIMTHSASRYNITIHNARQCDTLTQMQVVGEGLCRSFAMPNPFVLTKKICLKQMEVGVIL